MKEYAKALDDLDAILNQNANHTPSIVMKVKVLVLKGNEDEALSFLKMCKQNID